MGGNMKVAILSVSNRPTMPPHTYGYGGMTRINWWLAEELVALGHDVTMFVVRGSELPQGLQMRWYPTQLV